MIAVIVTVGMTIALLFGPTWKILGWMISVGLITLRWIIIVGLIFGLLNSPIFYHHVGWTPISLIAGDSIYSGDHDRN